MSPEQTVKDRSALRLPRCLAGPDIGLGYTSPHLSSVRERFRIGSDYISEQVFAELGTRICQVLATNRSPILNSLPRLALLWFAESNVDLVVLETGMGGRLDATNVVTPLVSIITSVSMDHEAYLGTYSGRLPAKRPGLSNLGFRLCPGLSIQRWLPVIERVSRERQAPVLPLVKILTMPVHGRWNLDLEQGETFGNRKIAGLRLPGEPCPAGKRFPGYRRPATPRQHGFSGQRQIREPASPRCDGRAEWSISSSNTVGVQPGVRGGKGAKISVISSMAPITRMVSKIWQIPLTAKFSI